MSSESATIKEDWRKTKVWTKYIFGFFSFISNEFWTKNWTLGDLSKVCFQSGKAAVVIMLDDKADS